MLWICAECTCRFSVDADRCPHCGSTRYRPQGEEDGPIYVIGEVGELPDGPDLGVVLPGAVLPPRGDEVELAGEPVSAGRKPARKPGTAG
jgi:ribosomal protein L40E